MDVSRLVLVAAAALALDISIPVSHAQDDDAVATQSVRAPGPAKPWKQVRGLGRVLDLSKPPVVIDEPGLYAIQQNWRFPQATVSAVPDLIQITADSVALDLHGFSISADISAPPTARLLVISGHDAEIRNGALSACCDGAAAVHSTGYNTRLHHLAIYSHEGIPFEGESSTISDSQIISRGAIRLASASQVERNSINCSFVCVVLDGDRSQVTDNRMYPFNSGGVRIMGNQNVVANNIMDAADIAQLVEGFKVAGNHNVVRNNTVIVGSTVEAVLEISGTANTLEGNIGAPNERGQQAQAGMRFTADGNYYGNNRMAAQVPFLLGGTVQTDWGGNVGY